MTATLWSRGLRLLVAVLCFLALCAAAFFGFIALVAFSDARHRCPGIQCSDAIGTGTMSVVIVAASLLGSLAGLGWLTSRSRR